MTMTLWLVLAGILASAGLWLALRAAFQAGVRAALGTGPSLEFLLAQLQVRNFALAPDPAGTTWAILGFKDGKGGVFLRSSSTAVGALQEIEKIPEDWSKE